MRGGDDRRTVTNRFGRSAEPVPVFCTAYLGLRSATRHGINSLNRSRHVVANKRWRGCIQTRESPFGFRTFLFLSRHLPASPCGNDTYVIFISYNPPRHRISLSYTLALGPRDSSRYEQDRPQVRNGWIFSTMLFINYATPVCDFDCPSAVEVDEDVCQRYK